MGEQNQNSIQQVFFGKDTISGLNKIVLQDSTLQNLSREGKQEIINILVKNMKTVYKSLETGKINKTNFPSIFEQFKKITLSYTMADIKKQNIVGTYQQSPSDLKFQRDFSSNPNNGNQLMDRPEPTKQIDSRNQQGNTGDRRNQHQRQQGHQQDHFSGFGADMGNYESSLDAAFRPIVDSLPDQDTFNNYDMGRNIDDIKLRMNSIQQARDSELNQRNARPPTPDFLKPKKTNVRADANDDSRNQGRLPTDQERRMENSRQNQGSSHGQVPDFKNMGSSQFNNGFQGLSNDTGDDLFSLDNIDKPLIDADIVEDNSSFEDRLKRLTSDRDNFSNGQNNNQQRNQIDFTSNNFPSTDMGSNSVNSNRNQQREQQNRQRQYDDQQRDQQRQRQYDEQQREQQNRQRQYDEQQREQQNRQRQYDEQQRQPNTINDLKTSMRSMNIDVKEDLVKVNQLKNQIENLENENQYLKNKVENLENELRKPSEIDKINQLKHQIAHEFETLNHKSEELEIKQSGINLKEVELNKKEIEVKQLIANYDYLFKSQNFQLEVSNRENKSAYIWSMEPIKNVIGIKLMSYSLPVPRFNIEQNKNGTFKYICNNNEYLITIPTGKYSIDDLLLVLNEKNQSNETNPNIKFSINNEQKIIFESSNLEDKIEIIPTLLSKENLGFLYTTHSNSSHIADRVWDLRVENKIYLYLNNLSDEVPFGILYFNGQSVSQFKFQDPFDLTNLEIVFKDSRGLPYDFYNLPHSLVFLIEKI